MPRGFTATTIVLLPKKPNAEAWTDYRPISLCNVTNKIITKILTDRLAPILPKVLHRTKVDLLRGGYSVIMCLMCFWLKRWFTT